MLQCSHDSNLYLVLEAIKHSAYYAEVYHLQTPASTFKALHWTHSMYLYVRCYSRNWLIIPRDQHPHTLVFVMEIQRFLRGGWIFLNTIYINSNLLIFK